MTIRDLHNCCNNLSVYDTEVVVKLHTYDGAEETVTTTTLRDVFCTEFIKKEINVFEIHNENCVEVWFW